MHRFQYMAVADNRQRFMPLPDDRLPGRCQALAYPEAVLLTNPKMPGFKGEVLFPIEKKIVWAQGAWYAYYLNIVIKLFEIDL